MKRLSNLLAALVFASLVIFMSCGGGGSDPAPTPEELAADNLVGKTWSVNSSSITYDNGVPDGDWRNFTLSFSGSSTGGSYTTSGVPDGFSDVWPASGSWSFITNSSGSVTGIDRGDVQMTTSLSGTSLSATFTVPDPNAKTAGLYDAPWTFSFTAPSTN